MTEKPVYLQLQGDTVLAHVPTTWATTFDQIIMWSIDVAPSFYSGLFIGDFLTRPGSEMGEIILLWEETGGWRLLN